MEPKDKEAYAEQSELMGILYLPAVIETYLLDGATDFWLAETPGNWLDMNANDWAKEFPAG